MAMKILALLRSMRPAQWTKNLFLFAALVFAQKFFELPSLLKAVEAFILFCFLSGGFYIFNDLCDRKEDKNHPEKLQRPIARGEISSAEALLAFFVFSVGSLVSAFFLHRGFFLLLALYFLLQLGYSLKLKRVVILDVFVIAAGFVIRVIAGAVVIDVPISSWLLICASLLSLFLAMSKRRHELVLLEDKAVEHRPILKEYSAYLLDQMMAVVTASTLIAYCLAKFGTRNLVWTSGFVLYGIFRYLYLVHQKGKGGSPEEIVLKDRPLLINIVLWIGAVLLILYLRK